MTDLHPTAVRLAAALRGDPVLLLAAGGVPYAAACLILRALPEILLVAAIASGAVAVVAWLALAVRVWRERRSR